MTYMIVRSYQYRMIWAKLKNGTLHMWRLGSHQSRTRSKAIEDIGGHFRPRFIRTLCVIQENTAFIEQEQTGSNKEHLGVHLFFFLHDHRTITKFDHALNENLNNLQHRKPRN